jgi:hypothetical protein
VSGAEITKALRLGALLALGAFAYAFFFGG